MTEPAKVCLASAVRWAVVVCLALNLAFSCVGLFDAGLDPQFNRLIDLELPQTDWRFIAFNEAKLIVASIGVSALCSVILDEAAKPDRVSNALIMAYATSDIALEIASAVAAHLMYGSAIALIIAENPDLPRGSDPSLWQETNVVLIQIALPLIILSMAVIRKALRGVSAPTRETA